MQSDPTELSNQLPNTTNAVSNNVLQYGFLPVEPHTPGSEHDQRNDSGTSTTPVVPPQASAGHAASLEARLRRLSVGHATPTKFPAQRIAEYENALSSATSKYEAEGPGFMIIKKKGHRLGGPRLDQFPNGRIITRCSMCIH
jgi:hypothetical protein